MLLPFKTYLAVTFPLAYVFPDFDSRHGWNFSLSAVLPGYVVCFFVLLFGGLAERACHLKQESKVFLLFAGAYLIVYSTLVSNMRLTPCAGAHRLPAVR